MATSHAAGWGADSPSPAQLMELLAQIKSGRVTKDKLQTFLRAGGAPDLSHFELMDWTKEPDPHYVNLTGLQLEIVDDLGTPPKAIFAPREVYATVRLVQGACFRAVFANDHSTWATHYSEQIQIFHESGGQSLHVGLPEGTHGHFMIVTEEVALAAERLGRKTDDLLVPYDILQTGHKLVFRKFRII